MVKFLNQGIFANRTTSIKLRLARLETDLARLQGESTRPGDLLSRTALGLNGIVESYRALAKFLEMQDYALKQKSERLSVYLDWVDSQVKRILVDKSTQEAFFTLKKINENLIIFLEKEDFPVRDYKRLDASTKSLPEGQAEPKTEQSFSSSGPTM